MFVSDPYFVSYSSVDGLQWATRLASALARPPNPIPVWLDKRSLRPGEDWDEQIAEAIRLAPALLFVVTEDSVRPSCVCKTEWAFALGNARPVIPLRFDERAHLPFRLVSREFIDFVDSFSGGVERLRSHLSWMDTAEGRRHEIRRQLEDSERSLARAASSERMAIQQRMATLRAELDTVLPPRPAVADLPGPDRDLAPQSSRRLDDASDAGVHPSPVGRSGHRPTTPPANGRDPIAILEEQAADWESELAPVRLGRMLVSPLQFYRGAGAVMAADLASLPNSGIVVQSCGDAALTSFGFVATAPTQLVFDIVSFDHTIPGPFEWDVKRLATSIVLAAHDNGCSGDTATRVVSATVKAYRKSIARFARISPFDVLHQPIEVADRALPRDWTEPQRREAWIEEGFRPFLTQEGGRERRLLDRPPLVMHVDEPAFASGVRVAYEGYLSSLPDQAAAFLQRYELVDYARMVLGVDRAARGDALMLLVRREDGEPLLLELIRPGSSVLEPYVGASAYRTEAERVVRGQRLLQAAADGYLGWVATADGTSRYVRRLRRRLAPELNELGKRGKPLANHGRACATALARGHARSGDADAIAGYLADGPAFDDATAKFARAYAKQTRRDLAAFRAAVAAGRLTTGSDH